MLLFFPHPLPPQHSSVRPSWINHCNDLPAPCERHPSAQMERTGRQQYGRVAYCPYSDSSSSELQSYVRPFDTVRALHETVVSLRTALEESRREVDQLRQQISVRETVEQGRTVSAGGLKGAEVADGPRKQQTSGSTEVPSTSGYQARHLPARESCEDVPSTLEDKKCKKLKKRKVKTQPTEHESCSSPVTVGREESKAEVEDSVRTKKTPIKDGNSSAHQKVSVVPDIQIVSHPGVGPHSAMASRIDVKIKVSSNILNKTLHTKHWTLQFPFSVSIVTELHGSRQDTRIEMVMLVVSARESVGIWTTKNPAEHLVSLWRFCIEHTAHYKIVQCRAFKPILSLSDVVYRLRRRAGMCESCAVEQTLNEWLNHFMFFAHGHGCLYNRRHKLPFADGGG